MTTFIYGLIAGSIIGVFAGVLLSIYLILQSEHVERWTDEDLGRIDNLKKNAK